MLRVATKNEIASAKRKVIEQFCKGTTAVQRTVAWPGGGEGLGNVDLQYRAKAGVWGYFFDGVPGRPLRFQFWFGADIGKLGSRLTATLQINVSAEPSDRLLTGRILADGRGGFYFAHKGELRGGRSGVVSITNFELLVRGFAKEEVVWPDSKIERVFVIGKIGSADFISRLESYILEASRLRQLAKDNLIQQSLTRMPGFNPGTFGKTLANRKGGRYVIDRYHEAVVLALQAELTKLGLNPLNTKRDGMRPDLYTLKRGLLDILFEFKTALDTSSGYTAIGQLVVYGAAQPKPPRRVFVCPGRVYDPNFLAAFKHLGIKCIEYKVLDEQNIKFSGVSAAVL